MPGGLWATLTHPKCDDSLGMRVYEEVHMLSHQIGAGQRADLKRLAQTQADLMKLERDLDVLHKRSRRQLKYREQRILELEAARRQSEANYRRAAAEAKELRQELAKLRADEWRNNMSSATRKAERKEQQLKTAQRERDHYRQASETAKQTVMELEAECREKLAECATLERLLAQSFAVCDNCEAEECANSLDLHGRKVLCVGGRNQLIDHYRALVHRCNGRFEHHDGGVEDNRQRLEVMLASADAVVCAIDCVSHDASYRLKRFCKRYEKPFFFLRSSGISTFASAIESVATL